MPTVDIRWRPSGGRGEYEHVPSDVIINRQVLIEVVSVPGAVLPTDVHGAFVDGKPRIRRDNPNDRTRLNIAPLMTALALLPAPIRENKGALVLPLKDKRYVVSSISFDAAPQPDGTSICTPRRMQILHDASVIDLHSRLKQVGKFIRRTDLPPIAANLARQYVQLVASGVASSEFRTVADGLIGWLSDNPDAELELASPSSDIAVETQEPEAIEYEAISVDETKRRLVSHYKIDRDRAIRKAKIDQFRAAHGDVHCENCGFSFDEAYGAYAEGVIDVHHTKALASLLPNTMTTLADLMLLCANCHRVVHRKKQPLTPDELRTMTKVNFGKV